MKERKQPYDRESDFQNSQVSDGGYPLGDPVHQMKQEDKMNRFPDPIDEPDSLWNKLRRRLDMLEIYWGEALRFRKANHPFREGDVLFHWPTGMMAKVIEPNFIDHEEKYHDAVKVAPWVPVIQDYKGEPRKMFIPGSYKPSENKIEEGAKNFFCWDKEGSPCFLWVGSEYAIIGMDHPHRVNYDETHGRPDLGEPTDRQLYGGVKLFEIFQQRKKKAGVQGLFWYEFLNADVYSKSDETYKKAKERLEDGNEAYKLYMP